MRSSYFPNGRVDERRYESDLPASFLASASAAKQIIGALLSDAGVTGDEDQIEVRRGHHVLQFGPGAEEVQVIEMPDDAVGNSRAADERVSPWIRAVAAARDADHAAALRSFEKEAHDAVEDRAPQRAAVAFRSAATAARAAGRGDDANRLLRLAGKSYLEIAESRNTTHQGMFLAYREAARCALEAGNLPLAQTSLGKAIAIGETLGYTDATPRAS
ncbi:MAG: hypothetical protein JO337_05375 [Acidimicrobiales bacterium]|nr:hypothetical protein [Acidimicrobiales bacterium]